MNPTGAGYDCIRVSTINLCGDYVTIASISKIITLQVFGEFEIERYSLNEFTLPILYLTKNSVFLCKK